MKVHPIPNREWVVTRSYKNVQIYKFATNSTKLKIVTNCDKSVLSHLTIIPKMCIALL